VKDGCWLATLFGALLLVLVKWRRGNHQRRTQNDVKRALTSLQPIIKITWGSDGQRDLAKRARTSISTCSCHCASMLTPYSILFRIPTSTATTKPRRVNAQHSTCTNANSPFYLQTCTVHRTNLQLSVTVYFGFGPPREGKSSVSFTSSDVAGTRGTP
jgi:hypothetical protein